MIVAFRKREKGPGFRSTSTSPDSRTYGFGLAPSGYSPWQSKTFNSCTSQTLGPHVLGKQRVDTPSRQLRLLSVAITK